MVFNSELHKGARQRAPTNSELFWDTDEHGFSSPLAFYRLYRDTDEKCYLFPVPRSQF